MAGGLVLLTGCATIVGDKTATVTITSVPAGATVNIVDESGLAIYKGATPTTVTLEKSTGHYWGGKHYSVNLSLPGYASQTVLMTTHANGWYIGGNIIFGGLIGWFLVDPNNGGMYTLSPEAVNITLTQQPASTFNYTPGQLNIMLVQDVPMELRSKLVKVGQLTPQ